MKEYMLIGKLLMKHFVKEKAGSAILEFLIIMAVFGVVVSTATPVVKEKLLEMYDSQSKDITFEGHKGDASLKERPLDNPPPTVDPDAITSKISN